jgi:hypothetical protein
MFQTVLNFDHLIFEFVSSFDIRISDFDEKWLSIYKVLKVRFNLLKSCKRFVMPFHQKVYA